MTSHSSETFASTNHAVSLDSISVCTENIEKTAAFLTDVLGWKRHPIQFTVDKQTGDSTLETIFFDGNGSWLQVVSDADSATDLLKNRGNGTYFKLNFSTDSYDEVRKYVASRGAKLLNSTVDDAIQHNLDSGESIIQRIISCTPDVDQKTTVDIYERTADRQTNLIARRDQGWTHQETDLSVPRIDRIAVIVENIEASVSFYTDVLGLKLHPMKIGVDANDNEEIGGFKPAFLYANSAWLVLIEPVGAGPLMDTLDEKGDGHVLEIITEVDDLDAFYDKMKAKGITLLCADGTTPLNDDMKSQVLEPHGDKIAYMPTEVSQGLVIEICERGPRSTSLIHQRDDTFEIA